MNWANPQVRDEFESVLRFWFDRGVDGMRIDAASALAKAPGLPDFGLGPTDAFDAGSWVDAPMWDVDAVHEILRSLRRVADEYSPPRMLLGEVGADRPERFAAYLRPDELHAAFQVSFMKAPWDAAALRRAIDSALAALAGIPALPTWVLSTHDETRPVTRLSPTTRSGSGGARLRSHRRHRGGNPPGPRGDPADACTARTRQHLPGRGAGAAAGTHPR